MKVTVIENNEQFNKLYTCLQKALESQGAVFNEPEYLYEGFTPHVTIQNEGKMNPGERWSVKQIGLIDLFPDDDYQMRRITKTWKLL